LVARWGMGFVSEMGWEVGKPDLCGMRCTDLFL
jgi:hypothetical protein